MPGITDLPTLLATLRPVLVDGEFVFVTRPDAVYGEGQKLEPIAAFSEDEGLTLVVAKNRADAEGQPYNGVFRMITLQVHSSLEAVGLTAAVAGQLGQLGISANVVAAYYHDHVFVPTTRAHEALTAIEQLSAKNA